MHVVTLCLILIALTCFASLLARLVKLPVPLVQIGVGVAVALPPLQFEVLLDPDTFLLLFIPSLLFGDDGAPAHEAPTRERGPPG